MDAFLDGRFLCSYCATNFMQFGKYERHLKLYHQHMPDFQVECPLASCKASFKSVPSFRRHIERNHHSLLTSWLNCEKVNKPTNDNDIGSLASCSDTDEQQTETDTVDHDRTSRRFMNDVVNDFDKQFTMLILRLKEQYILSNVVCKELASLVLSLVTDTVEDYKDVVCQHLFHNNIMPTDDEWTQVVNPAQSFIQAGRNCASQLALLSYLKRENLIVQPTECFFHDNSGKIVDSYQYIPIMPVLGKLLSHDDVFDHIAEQGLSASAVHKSTMDLYTDGSKFLNDPYFAANPDALHIQLYADELEICNPLGAKKGKQKVTAVYYLIGNIHPQFRSKQQFIHLACLARYSCIKKLGNNYSDMFKPLVHDLALLQEHGFEMLVNGKQQLIRGKLISISADNLAAHALAGFQQHFHCGRICRFCTVDYSDMANRFSEKNVTIRTSDMHRYHLNAVHDDKANSNIYGVQRECALSELPNFDVLSSFPPDAMHDILEGVIPLTVRYVLKQLIHDNIISLADINESLASIKLTYSANKPCTIAESVMKSKGHLSGSAAQKLELFLILPQAIGHMVVEGNEAWQVYLLLRQVCQIILAPAVRHCDVIVLEGLIANFLSEFTSCFGPEAVTPKLHYLIHYPRFISLYGPLKNFWCMRFESKHMYFKRVVAVAKCFKNITKTLANRHQFRQAWEMSGSDMLLPYETVASSTKLLRFAELPLSVGEAIKNCMTADISEAETVTRCDCLVVSNITYKVNSVYVAGHMEEEEIPMFFIIKHILCIRSAWLLCGWFVIPECFSNHLFAYRVTEDDNWTACKPGMFVDYTMHDVFHIDNTVYVSLRYEYPAVLTTVM
jgi:hypothetical protein